MWDVIIYSCPRYPTLGSKVLLTKHQHDQRNSEQFHKLVTCCLTKRAYYTPDNNTLIFNVTIYEAFLLKSRLIVSMNIVNAVLDSYKQYGMKNGIFPLISNTILPKLLTLIYHAQPETLAVIYQNRYVALKCYIEKWNDVSELYKLTYCSVGRHM